MSAGKPDKVCYNRTWQQGFRAFGRAISCGHDRLKPLFLVVKVWSMSANRQEADLWLTRAQCGLRAAGPDQRQGAPRGGLCASW